MKHKKLIASSIILVVSVVLSISMLLFTTNILFCYNLNILNFEGMIKCGKITEIAYKINPTYSNLRALSDTYSYYIYYEPYDENGVSYLDRATMPEDYYKKSAEYAKEMYDYYYNNPTAYKGNINGHTYLESGYLSQDQALAENFSKYVISLYLDGQKEKSQKEINEFIAEFSVTPHHDIFYTSSTMSYVITVHNLEKDEDFQKWMVETEKKLTEEYYKSNPDNRDKIENIFARSEFYREFDWQE